ncbi:hypothetical protein [Mucilaginibacter flavidus]|uniref:hypothetical protein n=1 Tax=Mucilaginibacter flavidus TaxID=2949309 RepID=UPI002093A1D7|nr:hypothetical protein [Mucilaginibacter flavidus]MCO5946553.1 hypothetical protein [Mucilaginibacter flavidus]
MISNLIKKILQALFILSVLNADAQVQFSTGSLRLGLDKKGFLTELSNPQSGKNYLYTDTLSALLTVVSNNKKYLPARMAYNSSAKTISLKYQPIDVTVEIKVTPKNTHLTLEIVKATPGKNIDAVIWGPFKTTIHKTVGEVIGVVRDGEVAVGVQVLNVKTLGGDFPNSEGSNWGRGNAATAYVWGSTLQAYTINRDRERLVDAWGGQFKNMPVQAIKGETVVGSKIALFTCAESKTLDVIETITVDEKLPYPTVNKTWFKKSTEYGRSYLISSFSEQDVDEMIAYTKKAGLISLYHEGPFKSWGHYTLNPEFFPNGKDGLKKSVEKAHAAGLHFGVHTLTNFINTNDSYVTPVPDDRLSLTGTALLLHEIDQQQKEIEVSSPEYFNQETNNNLHTVKIGKELIRYKSVTNTSPYKLLDCQRGAFGTVTSAHKKGETVGKLFDHPYQVFFPNLDLQREIARNMANLFNETGVDHFDFDGHEGCIASGEGDYAIELFAKDVYDNMKHEFICGTSNSKTFFWNIGSYYNWGEPWYGGFNESMQQSRIDNQGLFDRNLMPHMLGWYLLTENTTMVEMESMLARAAGYNAGFAMVARPKALRTNPITSQLLDAIREWETARTGNAFNAKQREDLKNLRNDFHLEKVKDGKWNLYQYTLSQVFVREKFERQPGEPTTTTWTYIQEYKEQPLQFRIKAAGKSGIVSNIKLQLDNYAEINVAVELKANESIVCDGTEYLQLYNERGKLKGTYKMSSLPPFVSSGAHTIIIDNSFGGEEPPKIEMQFKGLNKKEAVEIIK